MKMFDPDFNARAISARRRVTGNPWFKERNAVPPRPGRSAGRRCPDDGKCETDAILAAKGIGNATPKQHLGLQAGVRSSLENHASKTVERVGEGVPKRWKLI